jgi:glycosyltransferase involved in cell wall biosynthesis
MGGARANLDAMSGLPQAPANTIRVGLVATLARWKGHATFLEAIARLPDPLPVRAYIVGDAMYQTEGSQYSLDELRQLARSLGLADRVGFTGFVHTPEATFRALHVVVHASTAPEPFGLVIAEQWPAADP